MLGGIEAGRGRGTTRDRSALDARDSMGESRSELRELVADGEPGKLRFHESGELDTRLSN